MEEELELFALGQFQWKMAGETRIIHQNADDHLSMYPTLKWCPLDIFSATERFKNYYQVVFVNSTMAKFECLYNFHYVSGNRTSYCVDYSWTGERLVCEVDPYKERYRLSIIIVIVSVVCSLTFLCCDFAYFMNKKRLQKYEKLRKSYWEQRGMCMRGKSRARPFPLPGYSLTRNSSNEGDKILRDKLMAKQRLTGVAFHDHNKPGERVYNTDPNRKINKMSKSSGHTKDEDHEEEFMGYGGSKLEGEREAKKGASMHKSQHDQQTERHKLTTPWNIIVRGMRHTEQPNN